MSVRSSNNHRPNTPLTEDEIGTKKLKLPKSSRNETAIKITVGIKPGSTSPAQKQAWRNFWAKLIREAKCEQ